MVQPIDKRNKTCYAKSVKKQTYRFLTTVWHNAKNNPTDVVYAEGTETALDWPVAEIKSALAAGLLEEVAHGENQRKERTSTS
jgi:hypothetical protein